MIFSVRKLSVVLLLFSATLSYAEEPLSQELSLQENTLSAPIAKTPEPTPPPTPPCQPVPSPAPKEKWHCGPPSHLMAGFGIFDVDKSHPRGLALLEYRWQLRGGRWRPLVGFFIATDQNFFVCGGIGYDIFIGKKVVLTPSFSPGIYCHSYGKNLGFPINFRSAIELCYVLKNKGRIGAQFNHISNARMLVRNPGADSLYLFYAIPFPNKAYKKKIRECK